MTVGSVMSGSAFVDRPRSEFPYTHDAHFGLVSLVSVSGRNWCYLCGRIERVETGETVEIASIDAVLMHVAENMLG